MSEDLKLFKVIVRHRPGRPGHFVRKGRAEPLMSMVSVLFGFGKDLMPQLKVIVGFEDRVTSSEKNGEISLDTLDIVTPEQFRF